MENIFVYLVCCILLLSVFLTKQFCDGCRNIMREFDDDYDVIDFCAGSNDIMLL